MSKDALNQLRELLRAAVNHAEGDLTGEPLAMLAAHVKTRVRLIVGVVQDLAELGAPVRSRDQGRVTWARDPVRDILPGFEQRAVDRIARGFVGLLDDEIRSYQEKLHRSERRSPPVTRHPRHARYVPNYRVWPITIVLDAARSRTSA